MKHSLFLCMLLLSVVTHSIAVFIVLNNKPTLETLENTSPNFAIQLLEQPKKTTPPTAKAVLHKNKPSRPPKTNDKAASLTQQPQKPSKHLLPPNAPRHQPTVQEKEVVAKSHNKQNAKNTQMTTTQIRQQPLLTDELIKKIHQKIDKHKYYPYQARKAGIQGTAEVRFLLDKTGVISNIVIVSSSGQPILDRASIQTITQISPIQDARRYLKQPTTLQIKIHYR